MAKKNGKRSAKALEAIEALKANNRKAFIKILAAIAVVLLLGFGRTALDVYGFIPTETINLVSNGIVYLSAVVMAFIAGRAGIEITKNHHEIDAVCNRNGISKEDIKSYERG